jgi:hypothetical protein
MTINPDGRQSEGVPPSGPGLRPFGAEPQDASQAKPLVPNAAVVLVCGGRNYRNVEEVFAALDELHEASPIELIIQGGAGGADQLARAWAIARGVSKATFWANWEAHGRKAGPLRNQRMIDEAKPGLVLAFPGGRGTADMLRRANAAGVDIVLRPAIRIEARRGGITKIGPTRSARAGAEGIAQP